MLLDFENLELRAAIVDLRAHLATLKLEQALWDYGDYLEEKYRADQPRAPRGRRKAGGGLMMNGCGLLELQTG